MTQGPAWDDPLLSTRTRAEGGSTVTGLETELNALLGSMTLRPSQKHLQMRGAGLSQGSNVVSNSSESGKTPMESFLAEGYSQRQGAVLDQTSGAPGLRADSNVKTGSPITSTQK